LYRSTSFVDRLKHQKITQTNRWQLAFTASKNPFFLYLRRSTLVALPNSMGEPLEELESLIPGNSPIAPSVLPGLATKKPLLYQTNGTPTDSEQLNLIESAALPLSEFGLPETDAFIINKSSDKNSLHSIITVTETPSNIATSSSSPADPLIGSSVAPESGTADPLTNPGTLVENNASSGINKTNPAPDALNNNAANSLSEASNNNKTLQITTALPDPNNTTNVTPIEFSGGTFRVKEVQGLQSLVGIEFLSDGGLYSGELAIFSLEGMDKFVPGSPEFIREAARRALSNSYEGYVVISDASEGAKLPSYLPEGDFNSGEYKGIKTFAMQPGTEFGFMLVPNGTVQFAYDYPSFGGDRQPLFSMVTDNPDDAFSVGQIADVTGSGSTFAIEDMGVATSADGDYNDVIFRVTGATTSNTASIGAVINPRLDWRTTAWGKNLIDVAASHPKLEESIVANPDQTEQQKIEIVGSTESSQMPTINTKVAVAESSEIPTIETTVAGTENSQIPTSDTTVTGAENPQTPTIDTTVAGAKNSQMPTINTTVAGVENSQMPTINTTVAGVENSQMPTSDTTVANTVDSETIATATTVSDVVESPASETKTTATDVVDSLTANTEITATDAVSGEPSNTEIAATDAVDSEASKTAIAATDDAGEEGTTTEIIVVGAVGGETSSTETTAVSTADSEQSQPSPNVTDDAGSGTPTTETTASNATASEPTKIETHSVELPLDEIELPVGSVSIELDETESFWDAAVSQLPTEIDTESPTISNTVSPAAIDADSIALPNTLSTAETDADSSAISNDLLPAVTDADSSAISNDLLPAVTDVDSSAISNDLLPAVTDANSIAISNTLPTATTDTEPDANTSNSNTPATGTEQLAGDTEALLDSENSSNSQQSFANLSIAAATTTANPGIFTVGATGEVKIDYSFDGGYYEGELAIFSLAGMSAFTPGTAEFAAEALRRALTNSTEGRIVIRDSIEGAKFTGAMPSESDFGAGLYQGVKTFNMTPGDTFGVLFVPSGGVQLAYQHPWLGDIFPEHRPLISIPPANPNNTSYLLSIADITGNGNAFALEDMPAANSDGDFNDVIFKISGATGSAPSLDTLINPNKEWRNTTLGQQILGDLNNSNSGNNPPVVSPASARTYMELETTIPLGNLAVDAEGDPITISVLNPVNGTVLFDPQTKTASFKPALGFSGIASFDFLASDGFGSSTPATVTVNVSDVPLLNLDFVKRNPRLDAGESTELVVLGDFADREDVVLPDSYLTYTSFNPEVASIEPNGNVTGLVNGTSILSASRNNLQAVTALRVGELPAPTNDAEFNGALAEIYGLNVYPKAVTMTAGMARSLLVGIDNIFQSPDLKFGTAGTRYFPGNSNLLQVNSDGVITAAEEGVTNVTVIHGAAEQVVPVRISVPAASGAILGVNGGAVTGSDGSIVMLPPGALAEDTAISLTQLDRNNLSLQFPDGLEFAGAFNLDLGGSDLKLPAQLAIPAPAGLSPGTEVLFMRKGSLPDADGNQNPTWLIAESGVVDANGTIRTNSPPFSGIEESGEYAMLVWPALGLVDNRAVTLQRLLELGKAASGPLNLGFKSGFLAANAGLIGITAVTGAQFAATILLLGYLAKYLQSGLKIIGIPEVGKPVVTDAGVGLDPDGIPTVTATLNVPTLFPADPSAPPVLQGAEFKLENGEPTVVLTGSNFLNNSLDLGDRFEDLTVNFRVGDKTYPGTLIPGTGTDLGENRYKIAVKVPITVPVGESSITVSRRQKKRFGPDASDYEIVELESKENLGFNPACVEFALAVERSGDRINVINLRNALSSVENQTSAEMLVAANIPVGNPSTPDRPELIATTSNATRAYVTLRNSGRVSVVDLMALREIDTTPSTPTVDAISLPSGALPQAIVIDPKDNYAYIADGTRASVYVLDINPNSATYHQIVQTIAIDSPSGLLQLAINGDERKLFVTAADRNIHVVNIDPLDKPADSSSNPRKWLQQIGKILTPNGAMGITATSDPSKVIFTSGNRTTDGSGFGVLEIANSDPLSFAAAARYADLTLAENLAAGEGSDYFDVNEGVAVTVMKDGRYAFVAGRNERRNIDPQDPRDGGNIGIIKDPFGPNPQLVAATRPIPGSLTNNVALSSDDKYLIASYPTLEGGGNTFVFDVGEMIEAVENPGNYKLDARDRGVGSVGFNSLSQRNATAADLFRVPIDDINPLVSIAADYEITGGNWINNFTFSVPSGTQRAPIGIGGNPRGLAIAANQNWVELTGPIGDSSSDSNPLTPTFSWNIKGEDEECGFPDLNLNTDIDEVNLYVSVFPQGEGLLPGDRWSGLNSTVEKDYNPNRVLTAKWQNKTWTWNGISKAGSPEEFTLPDARMLTAGQEYHWGVEVVTNKGDKKFVKDKFKTLLPEPIDGNNTFSSVTVLTRGLEPGKGKTEHSQLIDDQINGIAKHIYNQGGAVKKYNAATGKWQSVTPQGNNWEFNSAAPSSSSGKPLVLLADWLGEIEPKQLYNSGFAEAAADSLFASLVQLDLEKGGSVGSPIGLYDSTGKLIRTQGSVFNSPLHFIGFGQGAVVNSEILQRLGTFFPLAGGTSKENRDLQMTTVDPYDYDSSSFSGVYRNILDPEIRVWNNVTYADNYYQTSGSGNTLNGRELLGANWKADWNVSLGNRAGFEPDNGQGASHRDALTWYAGTANLSGSKLPSENGETIYRRLGDLPQNNITDAAETWYTPDHTNANFSHGDDKAPWEGIGTGWFHSVLGGGSELRPYFDGGKKGRNELGNFEDYLKNNRVSVYEDNTYTATLRGDYAVPTLFNGNFDATIAPGIGSQPIPGWSFYNSPVAANQTSANNSLSVENLVDWRQIDTLNDYSRRQRNYALKLEAGNNITHNRFVVPDWGAFRLDLHTPGVPNRSNANPKGTLDVTIRPLDPSIQEFSQTITLQKAQNSTDSNGVPSTYLTDKYKVDYGIKGFESFYMDVPERLRGQVATVEFQNAASIPVYLDNVFFQSDSLRFGNPNRAKTDLNDAYQTNYLIEKPQYTLSYNGQTNTPNWVGWVLDQGWAEGNAGRTAEKFAEDPELPASNFYRVQHDDYKFESQIGEKYTEDEYRQFLWRKKAFFWADRGHLTPSADRQRSNKDNIATFLTTNIIPQDSKQNSGIWATQEAELRKLAKNRNFKFFLFAGGSGEGGGTVIYGPLPAEVKGPTPIQRGDSNPNQFANFTVGTDSNNQATIQVPDALWKVVLGFSPENKSEVPDIHFAWWIPNNSYSIKETLDYTKPTEYSDGQIGPAFENRAWNDAAFTISIEALEGRLNKGLPKDSQYDFLSNVQDTVVKKRLKEVKRLLP
jgi:DNA/RNA endonuclease G (NUC1)